MTRTCIGIDLGTTNTALAFSAVADKGAQTFSIPQCIAVHEIGAPPLLPSFLYLPAAGELPDGALALPWDKKNSVAVGSYAKDRGAQVPGRVIASAKSWLCHPGVDRRAAILPAGADDDVEKLSPVACAARLLAHVQHAWDHAHPKSPFVDQDIVLTVPASFDAVARSLTEEAARSLGVTNLTLLEEPQAALYAWVAQQGDGWRKQLAIGDSILVVDVGGGTTDFSLIAVEDQGGQLGLTRVAVGEHILLGGDNMDLALAYRKKADIEADGKTLDDWQLRALTHACRQAKELLLEDGKKKTAPLSIPGRGSKLVGGSIRAELSRDLVDEMLVEGFFPEVAADAKPQQARRTGLQTLGLPYAQDAGISRHLAAFLAGRTPSCILFNGGVMKSALLRERVVGIVNTWLAAAGKPAARVLPGADLDVAVAHGACAYARARAGGGLRIKGGAVRAYYVGIERAEPAVPGMAPRVDAVCIAPFGMEEGAQASLPRELGLVVGEPASFRFFSSSTRKEDQVSAIVDPVRAELQELAPIETTLDGPAGGFVPITLQTRVSEVGTLEIVAVESASKKRHKLEFQIRVE